MRVDVARLDLRGRRRSLVGYGLGLAVYCLVVVAMYPAFKDSQSLDRFVKTDSTAAALFGVTGSITSPGGWLNANIYANFFPLVMLLLTIGYGAACIAGQDEDGTLCLLATLPLSRGLIAAQKAAAMAAQAAVLATVVAVSALVGRSFQIDVSPERLVAVSAAMLLLGVDFGLLAMTVGAFTARRATALGTATALAATSYLISSLAPVISWLRPARYASLLYWSVGDDQITNGVNFAGLAILGAVAAVALFASVLAVRRLDMR